MMYARDASLRSARLIVTALPQTLAVTVAGTVMVMVSVPSDM